MPTEDQRAKEELGILISPTNNGSDPFNSTVVGSDVGSYSILQYIFKQARMAVLAEAFASSAAVRRR